MALVVDSPTNSMHFSLSRPVSAYALFFRDTQAAIKGSNPNASFGEVSKIVASMWDSLDADHKNVYKKKTEAAKKEYLKALAAYRASLVSKVRRGDCSRDSAVYVRGLALRLTERKVVLMHNHDQSSWFYLPLWSVCWSVIHNNFILTLISAWELA